MACHGGSMEQLNKSTRHACKKALFAEGPYWPSRPYSRVAALLWDGESPHYGLETEHYPARTAVACRQQPYSIYRCERGGHPDD
jgi:hypothetical protein